MNTSSNTNTSSDINTTIITVINNNKINDKDEKYIINLILTNNKNIYNRLNDNEINNIINDVNTNTDNKYINLKCIINSLKSTYITEKIMTGYINLKNNVQKIIKDYNKHDEIHDILYLSKKYDNSPFTILRVIYSKRCSKEKIKQIFKNPSILNKYDYAQFMLALENDYYGIFHEIQTTESIKFETKIEKFLTEKSVNFLTQNALSEEQINKYGYAYSTPDFLIKSNLVINNVKINWIDAKNFYGANMHFIKKKIKKQIEKYINNYGSGCIIFSCGFNEKIKFDDTLIICYEDLMKI